MIVAFFERLYFNPKGFDWVVIALLSPFSLIYGGVALIKRLFTKKSLYKVPVISIGNLIVGGSGKSPFLISLIKSLNLDKSSTFIVSRGYKRDSKGLVFVSKAGEILTDVSKSGDEPMLIAKSLQNSSVVVCKNRKKAVEFAIKNGAKVIFLDDGFSRVEIEKFEILLYPKEIKNPFPFPAGGWREFSFSKRFANLNLTEERDFFREVKIKNPTSKMVLATAIANPKRLDRWLDKRVIFRYYLSDHSNFDEKILRELLAKYQATSILTTQKDLVKMEKFNIPISLLELEIKIAPYVLEAVKKYIKDFDAKKY